MIIKLSQYIGFRAFAFPSILSLILSTNVMAHENDDQIALLVQNAEKMQLRIEALELKVSRYEQLFDLFDKQRGLYENFRKQQDWDYKALSGRLENIEKNSNVSSRTRHFRQRF